MYIPINFPCVMLEKEEHKGVIGDLNKVKFLLITSEKDYLTNKATFQEPIICHYYSVINSAVKILNLKFCNRLKTYIPK